VEFDNERDAERALKEMNGFEFGKRVLNVSVSLN
jgi:RNA recognition motif-containing protein